MSAYYDRAKADIEKALSFSKSSVFANYLYGVLCYKQGNYDDARKYLNAAVKRFSPEISEINILLAEIGYLQGDYKKSLELSESVLKKNPQHRNALKTGAKSAYALGDDAKTENYVVRILVTEPENTEYIKSYKSFIIEESDNISNLKNHSKELLSETSNERCTNIVKEQVALLTKQAKKLVTIDNNINKLENSTDKKEIDNLKQRIDKHFVEYKNMSLEFKDLSNEYVEQLQHILYPFPLHDYSEKYAYENWLSFLFPFQNSLKQQYWFSPHPVFRYSASKSLTVYHISTSIAIIFLIISRKFRASKKWATPTRSCSPIAVILVSKQRKTARLILRNFLWYKK